MSARKVITETALVAWMSMNVKIRHAMSTQHVKTPRAMSNANVSQAEVALVCDFPSREKKHLKKFS